jgi:hypothetical protein
VTIVAHPPSTITYRLTIPEGGVLRTAVGLNPEVWNKREGDAVQFSIALDDGSETQELMSKVINPKYNAEDQKWHPVEVPLDRWAGKKVRLSFITRPDPSDNSYSWAGWARPHIARSSDLKPWYFIYTGSKTAN